MLVLSMPPIKAITPAANFILWHRAVLSLLIALELFSRVNHCQFSHDFVLTKRWDWGNHEKTASCSAKNGEVSCDVHQRYSVGVALRVNCKALFWNGRKTTLLLIGSCDESTRRYEWISSVRKKREKWFPTRDSTALLPLAPGFVVKLGLCDPSNERSAVEPFDVCTINSDERHTEFFANGVFLSISLLDGCIRAM